MSARTAFYVKTTRLTGDSRERTQWETDGYIIVKANRGALKYRAFAVAITDPNWKWGACGPLGLKLDPVGPFRRTLAEAKADVKAAGPNPSGFHYSPDRDRRAQWARELLARRERRERRTQRQSCGDAMTPEEARP